MLLNLDADGGKAFQVKVLDIVRRGLDNHLKLVIVLQAVGVFTIASVLGTAAGLRICHGRGFAAQSSEKGGGMKSACAHFHIIGLDQVAALFSPVFLQGQDDALKGHLFLHSGIFYV
jgi:hypothetical protein